MSVFSDHLPFELSAKLPVSRIMFHERVIVNDLITL